MKNLTKDIYGYWLYTTIGVKKEQNGKWVNSGVFKGSTLTNKDSKSRIKLNNLKLY